MGFELTPLRLVWLGLAIGGMIAALWQGITAPGLSEALGLLVLGVWALVEIMVRRNWLAMWTLPAMIFGIGSALPLYLFFRSRRIV